MCDCAAAGEFLEVGEGPFELAEMQAWPTGRTIRTSVLRHLLIDEQWPADAKGVRLRGVRISGKLDFEAATLRRPLSLADCYLDSAEPACFEQAIARLVYLTGCHLSGFSGDTLGATDLSLDRSTLTGAVRLPGADITGILSCHGARLTGADKDGNALVAEGMKVSGSVFLDQGFTAAGAVRLHSADITGQLSCHGAQLTGKNTDGDSLVADGMKVGGQSVYLDQGFTAAGAVRLPGADITGQLSCRGAQLTGKNTDGNALVAGGMKVSGSVFLDQGFTAAGAVRLHSADIIGQLSCHGAQLTGADKDGNALVADGMKVSGSVLLDQGFTAAGAVRLPGADITGLLSCRGAQLTGKNTDGNALVAEGMKVSGSVFLDQGFTAAGAVRLPGADITGQLSCHGAQLTGADKNGNALVAGGMKVSGDVFLGEQVTAKGAIRLRSVQVGGSARLGHARQVAATTALDAAGMQIAGSLVWAPAEQFDGRVGLEGAAAGQLTDSWAQADQRPNGHWPAGGQLRLDGFTYGGMGGAQPATVQQRLDWIRSQYRQDPSGRWAGFTAQPYEQLATVYWQAGRDSDARTISIARRADLRRFGNLTGYRKAANWLLDKTIKYGYQTWRAALGLGVVYVAFLLASLIGQHHGLFIPVGNIADLHPVPAATRCTADYPCFYPAGYAIDVVIPIVNVHQADSWGPNGYAPWGWAWTAATWLATGLGWALATLLVAGYTGLARRQ
jgi:hypothetical protein